MTIEEAVGRLPTLERQALTLRKVYSMPQNEIAERLHITPEQVETTLCAAYKHMAQMVDLESAT